MVANTRKPRTGTEICVGQNMPAFTAHLVHKYGGADAVGFSKTSLAAEIDANNLRVRIEELGMAVEMAEKHCDDDTARSLADRQKKLSLQLGALIGGDSAPDAEDNPLLSEYRIHHLSIIPPTSQGHPQDGVTKVQAIKELRAASGVGLKDAKDLIEAVMAKPLGHTMSLGIRDLNAFAKAMAALGFMVIGENGVAVPVDTPPQDSQTFFNVRIRWMERTGAGHEMFQLIDRQTDITETHDTISDMIHRGGPDGEGTTFAKVTIKDFATFCRKAEEYGYEVELVEAPVAEEANPFVVRAPV